MPIHSKGDISYYTFSSLDKYNIKHGVFMRHGGVSPEPWSSLNMATSVGDSKVSVVENRRRITKCLSLQEDSIFDVWQVHSNKVIHTLKPRKLNQLHQKADAIITNQSNLTLMMLFADCVPIMMYDPQNNVVALAHAGWLGTVNDVVGETVKLMQKKFTCNPVDIIACIGPSICVDHYEIGNDVAKEVYRSFENIEEILIKKDGKFHLDLQRSNRINLQKHKIRKIQNSNICTACNTRDWFSHRAEKGKTGRFASVIALY